MNRFFLKDPEIAWKKIYCPVCNEPTGPKSECYKNRPDDIPAHKAKLVHKKLGVLPLYSYGCVYRQDNMWECTLNYPTSQPLIDRLSTIEGVEKISAVKKYVLTVSIGTLFDESIIKQRINERFKSFIKERQVEELNLMPKQESDNSKYEGITLPNGQSWKPGNLSETECYLLEDILKNIPNSKAIFRKSS